MRVIFRSVLLAALATGSLAVHGAQASGPQPKTTPALAETFTAAQSALDARRYPEAIAKAREILASPRKSPDDVYAANSFLMRAAQAQNDTRGMTVAMEGMLASGFSPGPAVQNQLKKGLASAYFQLKDYPQAIKHGSELIRAGAGDQAVYTVVGQSYYQSKNYGESVKLFGGLVSDAEKANRRPDRNQLSILYSAYDKMNNAEAAQTTLEKMVRHYPAADTWLVLLYEVKQEKLDPRQRLHLFRLMESTGNLKHGPDVLDYYGAATTLKLHAEAHRVLSAAVEAGAFAKSEEADRKRAERYANSASKLAAEAKANLPKVEAAAKSAPTGDGLVELGMQQITFGMYPQAIASLQAGIAKGGLKTNPVDAQLNLGFAQLRAGQKAEAVKTFRAIKTEDGITQRIAKFWALHAQ